jgi:hypothetical protein
LENGQDPDKRHQKQLEDLRAQHQAELATVVEVKAKAEAQIEEATQKIAALQAESTKKSEMSRKRIQGLSDTVKQKNASLSACNERIKELESQITKWRETGVPPPETPAPSTHVSAAPSIPAPSNTPATPATPSPATAAPAAATMKPPASPAVATTSQAPAAAKPAVPVLRKPSIDAASPASASAKAPAAASPTTATPAAGAAAPAPQTTAVRGARGGARGVPANARGLVGRGRGRGGAPGSVAAAVAAATGDGTANAAAKRPREDAESTGGEASLPKKPRGGPPVTIRRQGRGGGAAPPS